MKHLLVEILGLHVIYINSLILIENSETLIFAKVRLGRIIIQSNVFTRRVVYSP
jgi:hypothetical protein